MNPFDVFLEELLEHRWVPGEESGNGQPAAIPERLIALRHAKATRLVVGMLLKYGLLLHYVRTGTVIDLCCGSGFGAAYLAMQGLEVTALDCNELILERSARKRKRIHVVHGNLWHSKMKPHDGAVFVDALEHFAEENQLGALERAREQLKLWGILLVDTPIAKVSHRESSKHQWVLSWDDLGSLVEKAGFDIVDRYVLATFRDQFPVLMRTRNQPYVHKLSDQIVIARRRE